MSHQHRDDGAGFNGRILRIKLDPSQIKLLPIAQSIFGGGECGKTLSDYRACLIDFESTRRVFSNSNWSIGQRELLRGVDELFDLVERGSASKKHLAGRVKLL